MPADPQSGAVIAVNALAARFGGTAYAGVQIAEALARRSDVREVVAIVRPGSIVDRGLRTRKKIRRIVITATGRPEIAQRVAWELIRMPGILLRANATGMLTLSAMLPRHPNCPVVALQANPTPYEDPTRVGAALRRAATKRTARFAQATYVPSRHVARLVGGLPRMRVVPLGVDGALFRPAERPGDELLCVADFYAHKHHELLLDAYRRLPAPRPVLRLIGNPDVDREVFARVRYKAADLDRVVVAGRVPVGELVSAYTRARIFLIASDRESFCMPLAEALAAGVPAVARDHPTLRETGGPGAVYVAGDDPAEWACAIVELIEHHTRHADLRELGRRHAQRFSWDAFAAELMRDLAFTERSR